MNAYDKLREVCASVRNTLTARGEMTSGFNSLTRLVNAAEAVLAAAAVPAPPSPPGKLDMHDVHVTTPTMARTSIFNLPYRSILQCTRVGGWALYARKEGNYPEDNLGANGLRIDVAGTVIYDSIPEPEPTFRYTPDQLWTISLATGTWRVATPGDRESLARHILEEVLGAKPVEK